MNVLEMSQPSPNFPLARCEAMGEGARRAGEGSSPAKRIHSKVFIRFKKEPSSGLSATFSHAAGEGK